MDVVACEGLRKVCVAPLARRDLLLQISPLRITGFCGSHGGRRGLGLGSSIAKLVAGPEEKSGVGRVQIREPVPRVRSDGR